MPPPQLLSPAKKKAIKKTEKIGGMDFDKMMGLD